MYDNCQEIENFSTCAEISVSKNKQCVQLIGFYCNLCRFVAQSVIHAVLSRNLFCHNLGAFLWRKIEPKSTFVEKKWQIWGLSQGTWLLLPRILYYPPVHPKISECQGLICPLVMFEKWLRCFLWWHLVWCLRDVFCFCRWRHIFTCTILAAGIVVNKVALRDGLHQEWLHGNRLGQRSHYFLLRTNSSVALREQKPTMSEQHDFIWKFAMDDNENKWKSRVAMSFMILDFTLPWWFIILGLGSFSSLSCPSSLHENIW